MPIYEVVDGDALEAIEAQCRHIATPDGFSSSTYPTLDEVRRFMDMAYYKIAGFLVTVGYAVNQTAQNALGWLESLQVLEVIIMIELAYPISGSGQPSERFSEFVNQRDMMYTMLGENSNLLEGLGATKSQSLGAYTEVTGISISRKNEVTSDPDLVPFRFNRGIGSYPGIPAPVTINEDIGA